MASSRKSPPSDALPAHVGKVLTRYLRQGDRLVVAFSGGIDSRVLLDILQRLSATLDFALSAIHVDHGISASSPLWAEFCAQTCAACAVPLTIERVTLLRGNSLEATARQARHRLFSAVPAEFIVLAHHLDDQAETLLLQLLRGAGAKGLSAMPELRKAEGGRMKDEESAHQRTPHPSSLIPHPSILRPLLDIPRSDIEHYARARKLRWIDDESNADAGFDRNFVRHHVLPVIARRYPAYRTTFARASRHLAEAAHLLDELAVNDIPALGEAISLTSLQRLSAARAKNAVRHFLALRGMPAPNASRLDEFVRQLRQGHRGTRAALDLGTWRLTRFSGELRLAAKKTTLPKSYTCTWTGEAALPLQGLGGTLHMIEQRGAGISLRRLRAAPVTVRVRQGGERFRPDGRRPRRSLKNLLQEAGVPPWLRDRLPLVYSGETLVYVPGIGIDAAYRADHDEEGVAPAWEGK